MTRLRLGIDASWLLRAGSPEKESRADVIDVGRIIDA
jgi:hypothetical protein